jgi:hypothetical protein
MTEETKLSTQIFKNQPLYTEEVEEVNENQEFITFEENKDNDETDLYSCIIKQNEKTLKNESNNINNNKNSKARHASINDNLLGRNKGEAYNTEMSDHLIKNCTFFKDLLLKPSQSDLKTANSSKKLKTIDKKDNLNPKNNLLLNSHPINKIASHRRINSESNSKIALSKNLLLPKDPIIIKLKLKYKEKEYTLEVSRKETGKDIARFINKEFKLNLNNNSELYLGKEVTSRINQLISHYSKGAECNICILDLDEMFNSINSKQIKINVTINGKNLNFYISCLKTFEMNINQITHEIIQNLDKCYTYNIDLLREQIKQTLIASVRSKIFH